MRFKKFSKVLMIINILFFLVLSCYSQSLYPGPQCFTPDHEYGSCVPAAKCPKIKQMLENLQPPYPEHVVRYIRMSHCGSQGDIHYHCCNWYNVQGHTQPFSRLTFEPNTPLKHTHTHHQHFHTNPNQNLQNQPFLPNNLLIPQQQTLGERILRSQNCGSINGDRISNGENVRLSEFPWMVLLETRDARSRERFRCAGTLITNQYVLTAAHCAETKNDLISVRLGEHDLKSEEDCEHFKKPHSLSYCAPPVEDVAIESIFIHPDYKALTLQNDIALLRLVSPVEFQSHIKPICLPLETHVSELIPTDQMVAGWGVTEKGYASDILLKATIPLQPLDVCQNVYQKNPPFSSNQNLCAGGSSDKRSTCKADSGGPLFTATIYQQHQRRYVQFGITSAGSYACGGRHNLPALYTNVRTYMPWIISNIY